jgi:raffinose/stachyose/melibiose transport system substrate-binding protein
MIHANSPHKDEAAMFIDWVVSDEIQALRAANGFFPSNKNADISGLTPEIRVKLAQDMANAGPFTYMHVDHAVVPPIATAFLDALQAVIGGAMTPEQAAAETEAAAERERGPVT